MYDIILKAMSALRGLSSEQELAVNYPGLFKRTF
jgi:hypothetical protein